MNKLYVLIWLCMCMVATALPIYSLAQEEAPTCSPAGECSDSLYVCQQNRCVCRWGSFEVLNIKDYSTDLCKFVRTFINDSGSTPPGSYKNAVGVVFNFVAIFLSALIMVAAAVSIVIGGYIYMTAGGSADRVQLAKTWIIAALLGITIALTAWVILNTISPTLT